MNLVDKQARIAIVFGICSSFLFTYFFDPIFSFVGRVMLYFGSIFMSAYLDRLYSEVAAGDMNYSYLLVLLIYGSIVCSGITVIFYFGLRMFREKEEAKKIDEIQHSIKRRVLFSLLSILLAIFLIGDSYLRLKISTTFNQHLTILAPHISDKEYKELKANYALMKSERDYLRLREKMECIAQENKLELPINRLYP